MSGETSGAEENRGRKLLGLIGILAGIAILAHLAAVGYLPSPAAADLTSAYLAHTAAYEALILTAAVFAILVLVFVTGVSRWLGHRSPWLSTPAALALSIGVILVSLSVVISNGALDAASSATTDLGASYQSSATFEADFWANMMSWVANFGTLMMGAGMILFGWVPWNGHKVPNWLSGVLMIGGVVGIVGVVAGSDLLAGIPFFVLLFWCLLVGYILVRPAPAAPAVASA